MRFSCVLIVVAVVIATIISCEKKEVKTSNVWADGENVVNTMLKSKVKNPASITFSAAVGSLIKADGVEINIPANAFNSSNGTGYTGNVTASLQTVMKIKDMVFSGIGTPSDAGDILISKGMFMLDAKDASGNNLELKNGIGLTAKMKVGGNTNGYRFFEIAANKNPENSPWGLTLDSSFGSDSTFYKGNLKLRSWCNLDKYMSETPLTDISIKLPEGFGNTNTKVIFRYSTENSCVSLHGNLDLKLFTTKGGYYKVVEGRGAKILIIGKKAEKYFVKTFTISAIKEDHLETITSLEAATEADIDALVAAF